MCLLGMIVCGFLVLLGIVIGISRYFENQMKESIKKETDL